MIKAAGALFAMMNPFVALPMFLSLTQDYGRARQRSAAIRCVGYSLLLSSVVVLSGTAILDFFGITIDDFRVAGGLVLMLIALGMLNGSHSTHTGSAAEQAQQSQQRQAQADTPADVAFYPMAFPMIVGPGTITTIVVFAGHADGTSGSLELIGVIAVILATMLAVLWFAPTIGQHMSQTLRTIMIRLMGIILAAIAVDMMVAGVKSLFPVLGR